MKRKSIMKAQSRGHSGFARVLTMLAMLFIAATGAWAQEWLSGITNGDFSGDDVSSFCKKEYPSTDVVPVVIGANVGKDGTPGIVVKSGDDTANPNAQNWDTQFWIVLSEEMPAGSTIRVQFDYKASKAAKGSTEFHADPESYLTWQAIGDVNFTTEWKTFNGEFTIPKEADGMKSIAFKLQEEKSATDYYFDNFSVLYKKTQWTNIVANSDMEDTDVSCFYVKEQGGKVMFLPRITEGIGMDGSRAIKVQSSDDEPNSWDTQFHIRLPYVLPPGTMYRLSFDYKADKAGDFGYQVANEPNQYIWWTLDGWPAPGGSFTTEWQHYKKVFNVPADCDGVSKADDNDWLRQFRTIYANLSDNKVATEFIFDNVKVEILSNVVSTLTPEPVTDPTLMIPYHDDDDVAVGKLEAAIETYDAIESPTDDDKATLKAAIDQFKADNAVPRVDVTSKVGTAVENWVNVQNGKDFQSYTGNGVTLVQVFGVTAEGNVLTQEVTGLDNGTYDLDLFAASHNAWSGQWMDVSETNPKPALEEDATDVAYVFGTSQNTVQTWITARKSRNLAAGEPEIYTVKGIQVENGTLTMGLALAQTGMTEWHAVQIYSLKQIGEDPKIAYAAAKAAVAQAIADAKALIIPGRTEGLENFQAGIETLEAALNGNMLNTTELGIALTTLQQAMTDFVALNPYYAVTLAEGTEDADKWEISPAEATKGTTVTLKYSGDREVKSIKVKVKNAAPAEAATIYSWESPDGTVSQTGGTIAYVNGDTSNGDRVNYLHIDTNNYTICLNGKKNNITDGTASQNAGRIDVTLDNALAAGDVITITAYIYKDESKQSSAYIIFNGANGFDSSYMSVYAESAAYGDNENLYSSFNGSPKTVTVTVPAEAAGCKSFSMTRGVTGTNLFITKMTITRGGGNN